MARMPLMTGGCQCGAVRFATYAALDSTDVCHCRMCQKAAGGPFTALAKLPAAEFAGSRGAPAEWASSSVGLRQFCGQCGTPLGYRYLAGPETADQYLATGAFDEFQAVAPTVQLGMESRNHWLDTLDGLPARTTEQVIEPSRLARIVNFQHPDRETPAGWPAPAASR